MADLETPQGATPADGTLVLQPIGVLRTPWRTKDDAPHQGATCDARGSAEVRAEFAAGLQDLDGFSHVILLYWFDRAGRVSLVRVPFMADSPHGIFATRHPCRPAPIGLTVVRLLGISGTRVELSGVDMLDGTPLLDIKPYVPRWDSVPNGVAGWLEQCPDRAKPPGRE